MKHLSLFNKEPASIWNHFQDEMNEFIQSMDSYWPSSINEGTSLTTREWIPSVDIKEEEKQYVINADIPGVDPKDIEVSIDNGRLSIKGERKEEKKESKEGYERSECSHGIFYRSFTLPESADPDKVNAKGKNGVLTITVGKNKNAKHKPKLINIES